MLDRLDQAIKAVCPIDGLSVSDNVVTKIDFRPEATSEQRAAAQAIVDNWDWNAPPPVSLFPYELLELITDDQLVAIQNHAHPIVIRIRTKLQTIVSPMPMAGAEMQQALGALVAFGIITQEESGKLTKGESLHK